MTGSPARRRGLRYALLALAVSVPAFFSAPAMAGTVEVVARQGKVIASADATQWCIAWRHSVAGFEVEDCYALRDGRMVLEESRQPDFAAGLGHIPGRGVQRSDGAGGYVIDALDEPVPGNCYRLRVGSPRVNHRLVSDAGEISLTALAAGESVAIRAHDRQSRDVREC